MMVVAHLVQPVVLRNITMETTSQSMRASHMKQLRRRLRVSWTPASVSHAPSAAYRLPSNYLAVAYYRCDAHAPNRFPHSWKS